MFKELLLCCLAATCLSQAIAVRSYTADMDFLQKQKKIYDLLFFVKQGQILDAEYYNIGLGYDLEGNMDLYRDKSIVQEFMWMMHNNGFLAKEALFTPMMEQHRDEVRMVFELLYTAKDFVTFYKTACFCRIHLNQGLFVNAMIPAVLYREDTKYIRLPRPYEMFPNLYFDSTVMKMAQDYKMTHGVSSTSTMGSGDKYMIYTNYTGYYLGPEIDKEYKLDYFMEDVELNAYYYYMRTAYPFWLYLKDIGVLNQYRGMIYYGMHRQLMARYYLERLSHGLGEIENYDWYRSYLPGYYSTLTYSNGMTLPQRDWYTKLPIYKYKFMKEAEMLEMRITAAIDSGYFLDKHGKQVDIYTPEGFAMLCDIIEGNGGSANLFYYGSIDVLARNILGYGLDYRYKNKVIPSALETFHTSLRDPAFYRMYKKIMHYFLRYKEHLPSTGRSEVYYPGIKIESINVDKIVTYFDYCDTLINNAAKFDNMQEMMSMRIKARRYCLNHKPYIYKFSINSDRDTKVVAKIFLGPPNMDSSIDYAEFLRYNYQNFFMLDEFVINLKSGMNNFDRHSTESSMTYKDTMTGDMFYKTLEKSMSGGAPFTYTSTLYGFPQRLMIPKGTPGGFPYKLFVMMYPYEESSTKIIEYPMFGKFMMDKSMFYPLDKPMKPWAFHVPNMFWKDVFIYHEDNTSMGMHFGTHMDSKRDMGMGSSMGMKEMDMNMGMKQKEMDMNMQASMTKPHTMDMRMGMREPTEMGMGMGRRMAMD